MPRDWQAVEDMLIRRRQRMLALQDCLAARFAQEMIDKIEALTIAKFGPPLQHYFTEHGF